MTLTLDPVVTDPFGAIVTAIAGKIANTNLSFAKYLTAQGMPLKRVYTQTEPGGLKNAWDPALDKCPAVVIVASAFPAVDDMGIGDERWYFAVTIMFKMRLPGSDATPGFHAAYELIRTLFAGWRTPQLDPIGSIAGVCDYEIDGNVTPHISDEQSGRAVARVAFDLRVRFNKNILGGGIA